jgi:hypothetical protein
MNIAAVLPPPTANPHSAAGVAAMR